MQLKPFAQLIVGPAAAGIRIRSGPATRAALAEAGRPAATVGGVIHMDAPPDATPPRLEVLAHELVHAARPSGAPRFFADDHVDGEEREAVATGGRVAALIKAFEGRSEPADARRDRRSRRNPDLAWGTAGLSVGPGASPLTAGAIGQLLAGAAPPVAGAAGRPGSAAPPTPGVGGQPPADGAPGSHRPRRSAGRHRPGSGPGASGGSGLGGGGVGGAAEFLADLPPAVARLLAGSPGAGQAAADYRSAAAASFEAPSLGGASGVGSGSGAHPPSNSFPGVPMASSSAAGATNAPFIQSSSAPVSAEVLDWIVDAVEERILAELERRGMRFHPGVF